MNYIYRYYFQLMHENVFPKALTFETSKWGRKSLNSRDNTTIYYAVLELPQEFFFYF